MFPKVTEDFKKFLEIQIKNNPNIPSEDIYPVPKDEFLKKFHNKFNKIEDILKELEERFEKAGHSPLEFLFCIYILTPLLLKEYPGHPEGLSKDYSAFAKKKQWKETFDKFEKMLEEYETSREAEIKKWLAKHYPLIERKEDLKNVSSILKDIVELKKLEELREKLEKSTDEKERQKIEAKIQAQIEWIHKCPTPVFWISPFGNVPFYHYFKSQKMKFPEHIVKVTLKKHLQLCFKTKWVLKTVGKLINGFMGIETKKGDSSDRVRKIPAPYNIKAKTESDKEVYIYYAMSWENYFKWFQTQFLPFLVWSKAIDRVEDAKNQKESLLGVPVYEILFLYKMDDNSTVIDKNIQLSRLAELELVDIEPNNGGQIVYLTDLAQRILQAADRYLEDNWSQGDNLESLWSGCT